MVVPGGAHGVAGRQRHRRPDPAVRGQGPGRQGGAVRGHVGHEELDLRARHPHRRGRERGQPGRGAVPEHRRAAASSTSTGWTSSWWCCNERSGGAHRGRCAGRPGTCGSTCCVSCAALLVGALLQTTVAPNVRILGANPDFALIVVVCVGLLRGCRGRRPVRLRRRRPRVAGAVRAAGRELVRLRHRRLPRRPLRRDRRPAGVARAGGHACSPPASWARACSPWPSSCWRARCPSPTWPHA